MLAENSTAAFFAVIVTLFFWWENIKGIPESSHKALKIMQVTTVMVVLLIVWCGYTVWVRGAHLPPFPWPSNIQLDKRSLGWLYGHQILKMIPMIAVFVGIGHSVLAMSGEESLAQVYREIEAPKLPNLKKAGLVIFVYSLLFTSLVSFFAVMIIPDSVRGKYLENLIGGLAMNLAGPFTLRLVFHVFVVSVGTLILAGAVNTAIIGSNGVLNRVSEDGVLAGLVPATAPEIRHFPPDYQYRCGISDSHHYPQPWRRFLPCQSVRVWCDLEFYHAGHRGFGDPLHASRRPRVPRATQFSHVRQGDSAGPGADHADVILNRYREFYLPSPARPLPVSVFR